MKRIAGATVALLLALSLVACSPNEDKVDVNPGKGKDGAGSAKCGDQ
jgi:hypothetical protein